MTDKCKHSNTSATIDCLELAISLKCDNCGHVVASRKLTEEEVNKIISKEVKRYDDDA